MTGADRPPRHDPEGTGLSAGVSLLGLLALEAALGGFAFFVLPKWGATWADRGQALSTGQRWMLGAGHLYVLYFFPIVAATALAWALSWSKSGPRRPSD